MVTSYAFRLTPRQRADLAIACSIGANRLAELADLIEGHRLTIKRREIEDTIREAFGSDIGRSVTNVLLGIAGTFRRGAGSADEALQAITRSLEAAQRSTEPSLDQWRECLPAFARLLSARSIVLAAKALDIAYDFERIFQTGRVITSVRPVFDEERENIVGSAVVQTLRLEYSTIDGSVSSLSVAIDLGELIALQDECERAIRKAKEAQKLMDRHGGLEVILPGEDQ